MFCTVFTFTPLLHRYHFWLPKPCYCYFLPNFSCFWMLSSTFDFFIDILFRILFTCKCHTKFSVLFLFFNDPWICVFSYVGEFWVRFKNRAVFILINQLMQTLSSRGILPDECSLNVQKVVKKFIWMNSFLTKMQFFSMLRVFRRENKIRKISLEVSFKNFPNAFKKRLFCRTSLDGY